MVDDDAGDEQAHVAEPIGDEGPQRRADGVAALVEEPDEQRRRDAEKLPAGEEHVDAPCEHHQVHARAEEREQNEEPREAGLAMEILAGKGIHKPAEAGGETDVGHREAVGHEFDRGGMVPDGEERAEMHHLGREAAGGEGGEREQCREESSREAGADEAGGRALGQWPAEQGGQADGGERRSRGSQLPRDERGDDVMQDRDGGLGHRWPSLATGRSICGSRSIRARGRWPRWPRNQSAELAATGSTACSGA